VTRLPGAEVRCPTQKRVFPYFRHQTGVLARVDIGAGSARAKQILLWIFSRPGWWFVPGLGEVVVDEIAQVQSGWV
jgi:hypothetical protein